MKKIALLMIMLLAGLTGYSQDSGRTISGTVYAKDDGLPLPGVTVKVTGTNTGTQTNQSGKYSITLPAGKDKLTFAFVGFEPQTIKVGKKDKLDVKMEPSSRELSEVVVTGYGTSTSDGSSVFSQLYGNSAPANNTYAKRNAAIAIEKPKRDNGAKTSLEDLLKKMEGLSVDDKGNLSSKGQAVTKIKLNGKDYAGGDVAKAIQNLPADIIEKVQMIDDYGDQAAKNGIKTSVLNITTRADVANESYGKFIENKYQNPLDNPLSTFSVDVDAASYSNIRRFINGGQLPPKDAVRIEEMINYFKYQLPEPKGDEPVAIATELAAAPWNPKHRLLRIGLQARTIKADKLPASNLVFLIDVSGSMNEPNKLPLVKQSMKMLVDQLRRQDKVAIVVYAGNAGLVLPATSGDEKETINDAIDNLSAGGSTAGGEGIKLAYKIARENFRKGGNNRIVMATDGDFNVGASSDESMEQLITKERDSGVDLSIMGFGMGNYKDSKMETLADKGNGNYAYIDNLTEAHKALVSEFGGTMFTVAKDVKLQIEFNPAKVQAYRLIGYENRLLAKEDFNNDKKDAGDMGSGHAVTAFYEIIPAGVKDDYSGSVDPLKYQKVEKPAVASASDEMATIKFRYKQPQGSVSKLSQATVMDTPKEFDNLSADYRFAAAVAEAGMLLRESDYKANATFDQAIKIAKAAKGNDEEGYRSEFVRLMQSARSMNRTTLAKN
ncbi:von Willebrand factor type A domain-containing protein [Mucilaginibacter mali]|uniref:von Willebrand factor type A domain-containing protein n=1 Tax=Mucilaginibacter mali TaxID=2740462 RepID=A0A7D4TXK1_9SPHI|nr:VWA domain-containing protein [Mucilaginibacter mali]QKJ32435.1 von Willebrand factor type A domain-containing protein [Mucilaginibacter mali]